MRFGGIVLVTALLLGACSSDPEPVEPTRSSPPTPTVTPPAMPDQAREDTPEGAAAFVKHYVDVFNYAASTGDVEELSRLSSPACEGCQSYIDLYRDTYQAGGYFKGGDWTIGDLSLEIESEQTFLTTRVDVADGRGRSSADSTETAESGETTRVSFAAARDSEGWRVQQLGLGDVK
ncbi:DUF6318 family protein [Aeromicrobium stalagmiti]|uniref:DUF6318 family protein n=1 Tax=Aeromicrobium stalagmiti TaxID=2738988 RepID=UPI00156A40F3|nr:DUF6318 family protein [Aeromicrobium stalagmiti]NRQ50490.1 hypothetical protein [Aeromicrobium stalagmiti]